MFAFCRCVLFITNFNLMTVGRTKEHSINLFALFVLINLFIMIHVTFVLDSD